MASITINQISNDNILNYKEYNLNLTITGITDSIPQGEVIYLTLDGKTIQSTVQSDKSFSFTIPTNYISQDTELYVKQLNDKCAYIVKVFTTTTQAESMIAFYVDLSTNVMSYDNFVDGVGDYVGLPQDGDVIDAKNATVGPIQNRKDLLYLDSIIGDTTKIIDQKSSTYDNSAENDLESPNGTISNAISQLRVDVGNKNLLYTTTKNSLVSAINELKENMYRPSQALNLVAHYDYQTNGNYVLNGATVSFTKSLNESEIPSKSILMKTQPYQIKRDDASYPTTSTKYNQFSITAGKMLVKGYEVILKNTMEMFFQNTMEDEQPLHRRKYEDDVVMKKTSTSSSNDIYKISYLDSYIQGIYSVSTVQGVKTYNQNFTFTTNGSSYQQLNTALKNAIITNNNITFDDVKIVSIPTSLTVNGTSYTCELDLNGFGINWKSGTPPSGISCTINSGNLVYRGILNDDGHLSSYVSISDKKDSILVSKSLTFTDDVAVISLYRITPRYDKIVMSVDASDYKSNYWDSSVQYNRNDVITYNGIAWKALISNVGTEPVSGETWENLGLTYEGVTTQPVFIYKEGYNNSNSYPVIPTSNSDDLVLCTILNIYGQEPIVKSEYVSAYKMTDIKKMEDLLNDGIYNLARLSLTQNLSLSDSNLTKNMFVDPFFDDDMRDSELELAHVDTAASNSMFIQDGILTHSISFQNVICSMTSNTPYIQFDCTEASIALVEQPLYSRSVLINKYQVTTPPIVNLTVSPQAYTWFDETQNNTIVQQTATVNGSVVDYESVSKIINSSTTTTSTTSDSWSTTTTTTTRTTSVTDSTQYRTDVLSSVINEPRKVPQYNLTITAPAYSFNGGEELRIQLGDVSEFAGVISGNIVKANANGSLNTTIAIGGDIKPFLSGDRILTVEGIGMPHTPATDYISGAKGVASVTQTPFLKTINNYEIINKQIINTSVSSSVTEIINSDPLAETFVATKSAYLHSVYVMVDAINGNNSNYSVETSDTIVNETILPNNMLPEDLEVVLFGCTAGYPDHDIILAKGILPKGTIINQTSPQYSKIELFPKIKLEKDKTYSFCVATGFESYARRNSSGQVIIGQDNLRLKLRSIKLGEYYPNPGLKNTLYNQQSYINGVMLSSSNMYTWTAHQDEDLTFKLTECLFTGGSKTVQFNSNNTTYNDITDIVYQAGVECNGSTAISHKLKYGIGNTSKSLQLINGEHKILQAKIGTMNLHQVECVLNTAEIPTSGMYYESPKLFKEASLFFGTIDPVSVYVTKNIDLTGNSQFSENKKLRVYLDVKNFSNSRMKVYYTTDSVISDASWNLMYNDTAYVGPTDEKRFFVDNVDSAIPLGDNLRIKIVLKTDINVVNEYTTRIGIKNLRVFAY